MQVLQDSLEACRQLVQVDVRVQVVLLVPLAAEHEVDVLGARVVAGQRPGVLVEHRLVQLEAVPVAFEPGAPDEVVSAGGVNLLGVTHARPPGSGCRTAGRPCGSRGSSSGAGDRKSTRLNSSHTVISY